MEITLSLDQDVLEKPIYYINKFSKIIRFKLLLKLYIYINFEDERLIDLNYTNLNLILESYAELFDQKPDLFFDEIQNITNWEKFARRLADEGYIIFITGSNSNMLSRQIASTLDGKFIIKE